MKATTILAAAAAAFLPATDAWQIVFKGTDGRQGAVHGTVNTACINLAYSPALKVKEAVFSASLGAPAYQLYTDMGCTGLTWGKLSSNANLNPPNFVRSYKIHVF